jgi:hypothetical protein
MKRHGQKLFEEAARLFSENEAMFGDLKQDKEKANLYRGLAALAEGLGQLQTQMSQEQHEEENRITTGRHPASVRSR